MNIMDIIDAYEKMEKVIRMIENEIVLCARTGAHEELKKLTKKFDDMQLIKRRLMRAEIPETTGTVNLYNITEEIDKIKE